MTSTGKVIHHDGSDSDKTLTHEQQQVLQEWQRQFLHYCTEVFPGLLQVLPAETPSPRQNSLVSSTQIPSSHRPST